VELSGDIEHAGILSQSPGLFVASVVGEKSYRTLAAFRAVLVRYSSPNRSHRACSASSVYMETLPAGIRLHLFRFALSGEQYGEQYLAT
jgi:hypothetical protein